LTATRPLATIIAALDEAGIPHMLAGSLASSYHGDPRTTNDIDLVIDPTRAALLGFVRSLDPADYYVSEDAAVEAFERRGQFNVVMLDSGWKADLILCKRRDFSRSEFERRERVTIDETHVFVATAEDTVIAKLEWAKAGQSERQLRDVSGILDLRADTLDRDYIEHWVRELGLEAEWQRISAGRNTS
jgi:hypothetical protein